MSERLNGFTDPTCPFTDKPFRAYGAFQGEDEQYFNYDIDSRQGRISVSIQRKVYERWKQNPYFVKHRHLVASAWYNGISIFDEKDIITFDLLRDRITTSSVPKTPKEKLDNILKSISEKADREGGSVNFVYRMEDPNSAVTEWYMRNTDELSFYVQSLKEEGYIKFDTSRDAKGKAVAAVTFKGLQYLATLEESGGRLSKRCFVAMAFSESQLPAREAIVRAIEDSGYIPVIIDSQNINSDKTINDQIIAEIRRSKFCIADFTLQRNGVYFEAGFALGLNLPVIYLCDKADFPNSHFDLKPFQHILYADANELYFGLKNKIAAWIQ